MATGTGTGTEHPRRWGVPILLAFLSLLAGSITVLSIHNKRSSVSSLRTTDTDNHVRRRLKKKTKKKKKSGMWFFYNRRKRKKEKKKKEEKSMHILGQFADPRSTTAKMSVDNKFDSDAFVGEESRKKCQVVYILSVEGTPDLRFLPILETLALNQVDPETGLGYVVDISPDTSRTGRRWDWFRSKLRGGDFEVTPEADDPALLQTLVREACPDDGRKHVLIEWLNFPSGHEEYARTYRIQRQDEWETRTWRTMTVEEIANSDEALQHPANLDAFYQAFSPYVDIKYVVMHRPFLETIASHHKRKKAKESKVYSNIIRGFMLMLRRFLDTHIYDLVNGSKLWSLVCVESIMATNYENDTDVTVARERVMSHLSEFLQWPTKDCPRCFDKWKYLFKGKKSATKKLGKKNVPAMLVHRNDLSGVWPPPGEEGIPEQQCEI